MNQIVIVPNFNYNQDDHWNGENDEYIILLKKVFLNKIEPLMDYLKKGTLHTNEVGTYIQNFISETPNSYKSALKNIWDSYIKSNKISGGPILYFGSTEEIGTKQVSIYDDNLTNEGVTNFIKTKYGDSDFNARKKIEDYFPDIIIDLYRLAYEEFKPSEKVIIIQANKLFKTIFTGIVNIAYATQNANIYQLLHKNLLSEASYDHFKLILKSYLVDKQGGYCIKNIFIIINDNNEKKKIFNKIKKNLELETIGELKPLLTNENQKKLIIEMWEKSIPDLINNSIHFSLCLMLISLYDNGLIVWETNSNIYDPLKKGTKAYVYFPGIQNIVNSAIVIL